MMNSQTGPRHSDEGDAISLWLRDSLSQAQSVLASAGSRGWSESQIQKLQREVDFFAALVEGSPIPPRPPDHVLEHVRSMLTISEQRAQEAKNTTGLNPRQMAVRDAFLDGLQRVRQTIKQFDD